jgi:hypothetical protein
MDDHTQNEADAPAAGDAGFPRCDGAACTGCGTWHRRYGPCGGGALCQDCRVRASSWGANAGASAGCMSSLRSM